MPVDFRRPEQVKAFEDYLIKQGKDPNSVTAYTTRKRQEALAAPDRTDTAISDKLGILGMLTAPLESPIRTVLEAGRQTINAPRTSELSYKSSLGQPLSQQERLELEALASPKFISDRKSSRFTPSAEGALQIAKEGASVGAYALPVGKTFKGALALGGLRGGLSGLGSSQADTSNGEQLLTDVLKGAGTGAVLEGGIYGIGKGISKLAEGRGAPRSSSAADRLRKDIVNPKVQTSPTMASKQQELLDFDRQLGLKGSASDRLSQIDDLYKNVNAEISARPELSKALDKNAVKKMVQDRLDESLFYDANNPAQKRIVDKIFQRIDKSGNNVEGLLRLKERGLPEASTGFSKIAKGVEDLPDDEKIAVTVYDAFKDALNSQAPGLSDLTELQSGMYKLVPGLAESAKKSGGAALEVLGTKIPVPGQEVQRGKDALARILEGGGRQTGPSVIGGLAGKVAPVAGQVVPRAATIGATQPRPQQVLQEQGVPLEAPAPQASEDLGGFPRITKQALMEARLTLKDSDYKKIKDVYDMQQGDGGGKPLTGTALQNKNKAITATRDLDRLAQLAEKNPQDVVLSALPGALGAREYRSLWGSIIDIIGTLRTGASYTPAQRQDYDYLLPKVGDSKEDIQRKISRLQNELSLYTNAKGGGDSIEEILSMAGGGQ